MSQSELKKYNCLATIFLASAKYVQHYKLFELLFSKFRFLSKQSPSFTTSSPTSGQAELTTGLKLLTQGKSLHAKTRTIAELEWFELFCLSLLYILIPNDAMSLPI